MVKTPQSDWDKFKANTNPLVKIRELKAALRDGPGLPALYAEAKEHHTVLGIPILVCGRNLFLPRQRVIDTIEGRNGQAGV
jgi:hypothetical protein